MHTYKTDDATTRAAQRYVQKSDGASVVFNYIMTAVTSPHANYSHTVDTLLQLWLTLSLDVEEVSRSMLQHWHSKSSKLATVLEATLAAVSTSTVSKAVSLLLKHGLESATEPPDQTLGVQQSTQPPSYSSTPSTPFSAAQPSHNDSPGSLSSLSSAADSRVVKLDNPGLLSFFTTLLAIKPDKNGILNFDKQHIFGLDAAPKMMLVRECYKDLHSLIVTSKGPARTLLLGSPGIGTSHVS